MNIHQFILIKLWSNTVCDYTIWPFKVDRCKSPFKISCSGIVSDSSGKTCSTYPDVEKVLITLSKKTALGIASRIEDIAGAYQLLHLLNIFKYFTLVEIYPCGKLVHFRRLQKQSGVKYSEMLFFDDDRRNIRDVGRLGVKTCQVYEGISVLQVVLAMQEYSILYSK